MYHSLETKIWFLIIFLLLKESLTLIRDMVFLLTFNYFVPFGVIENRFTKINFKYFNGNGDYSSFPGWWILFLYAAPHNVWLFEKIIFELDYLFHIVVKSLVSY